MRTMYEKNPKVLRAFVFGIVLLAVLLALLSWAAMAEAKRLKITERDGGVVLDAVDEDVFDADTFWQFSIVENLQNIPTWDRPEWLEHETRPLNIVVHIHVEKVGGAWKYHRSFNRSEPAGD